MKYFLQKQPTYYFNSFLILIIILFLGAIARIGAIFVFANLHKPEMWEFGNIAQNLSHGLGYQYHALTVNVPSAYMPPAIPYIYSFFFSTLGEGWTCYFAILVLNTLISVLSAFILYHIGNEIYSKTVGLLSAIYACFSPIFIYSAISFSAIIFYHFFILLCFIFFNKAFFLNSVKHDKIEQFNANKYIVLFSIALGCFLLFRAEMLAYVILIPALLLLKKRIKHALLVLFIPLLIISPWTIRNYLTFGKVIPITTSTGYNFYNGHGDDETAIEYNILVGTLKEDSTFEIKRSEIAYQIAFQYIKEKPLKDIKESLLRISDLWIIDRYRESAKNPAYIIIWLFTLLLFIIGFLYSLKDSIFSTKIVFLKIFIIFITLFIWIYFNIPRYQIQMSIVLIPTAMFGLLKTANLLQKIKK